MAGKGRKAGGGHRPLRGVVPAAVAAAVMLATAAALPAAEPPPVGEILNAGSDTAIEGSYIVSFADVGVEAASTRGAELAASYGAQITTVYKRAINGYAIEASEEQAKRFAADPAVDAVVQNERVRLSAEPQPSPPSWGLDRIDQPRLPLDRSYTYPAHGGKGVTAYIIDTGIHHGHTDFEGRATPGFDAYGGNGEDGHGHGTHVAGTTAGAAHGVAKKASLVSVKVLDESGSGSLETVVAGIDWVTENAERPAVANMSLGAGATDLLDDAVRNSVASGVTYVVAAGNESQLASQVSPARVAEAITVAATGRSDVRARYSNWGPAVQIFAPGSDITSAWTGGDRATRTVSGTSMAAPHVAGTAALYLAEHPQASPRQVARALDEAAVPNRVILAGVGTPNRLVQVRP